MDLNGKKICVTGGMGYIGSHTALALKMAGAEVYVVDRRFVKQNVVDGVTFIKGDYANPIIATRLETIGIDAIVHCAGTSLVGPSYLNPDEYYSNNVIKTITLLDYIKEWAKKPYIVFSSSAAVYGNPGPRSPVINEDTPLNPINPYGHTKMMIEKILNDYHHAYGIEYFAYRYFNAAGADTWFHNLGPEPNDTHIIPRIFEEYYKGGTFKLYGTDYNTSDGSCIRDYIHVNDIAIAHTLACRQLMSGSGSEVLNLGTSVGYSNLEILQAFEEYVGPIRVNYEPRRIGDPDVLVADARKIEAEYGWTPEFSDLETIMTSFKSFYEK